MVISSISTACRGRRGLDTSTPDLGLVKRVDYWSHLSSPNMRCVSVSLCVHVIDLDFAFDKGFRCRFELGMSMEYRFYALYKA